MKLLLGLFLIAHGLLHASYLTPKPDDSNYPFDFTKGWFADLVPSLAKPLGMALVCIVVLSFLFAGLGMFGLAGLDGIWKLAMTVGAVSSTLLLILFWHPWLILGLVINLVILYGLYALEWTVG